LKVFYISYFFQYHNFSKVFGFVIYDYRRKTYIKG
jgi:hypothetical protein